MRCTYDVRRGFGVVKTYLVTLMRGHRRALVVGLAVLLVISFLELLWPGAWWLAGDTVRDLRGKDRADAINGVRQTLLQTAGGLALLTGLAFTARTYYLSRAGHQREVEAQITDRYTRAVEQLGSTNSSVRIGGIYALERIMRDSPKDHETIVEVLAAFIRERSGVAELTQPEEIPDQREPRPTADVQAALTVLGRRPDRVETNALDLAGADLRGAKLRHARLQGADLRGSQLQRADLLRAQLQKAHLQLAQLQGADLSWAQLDGAWLNGAQLQGADFSGAELQFAYLSGAQLQSADLRWAKLYGAQLDGARLDATNLDKAQLQGANLEFVPGLTWNMLTYAEVDNTTRLPYDLIATRDKPHPDDGE